jgi:ATPase subunit of ABC transporter with duplicated ATPase domains
MLNVQKVNHDFGGRTILSDVSFRLKKGEHVALVGPNGEGKSTFLKIITNKLMPDEGVISWSPKAKVGYLDQHAELEKGNTIREVLKDAFKEIFDLEKTMIKIYEDMESYSAEEMEEK